MVNFIDLIRAQILPSISDRNEVCFAYEDVEQRFYNVTAKEPPITSN